MSLSNLTSLTQTQYRALPIIPFQEFPICSSSGYPDNRVSIQLGGWVGSDVMAFIVSNVANSNSSLGIERTTSDILVNVATSSNPALVESFWTVNMGAGASGMDWQLTFDVADGNTDTGKWVFTKGKSLAFLK